MIINFKGLKIDLNSKGVIESINIDGNAIGSLDGADIDLNDEPNLKNAVSILTPTNNVFYHLSYVMNKLVLPDKVNFIQQGALEALNFREIVWPTACKKIEKEMFKRFSCLQKISNISNVEEISEGAFSDCTNLKAFDIPPKVRKIPDYCFNDSGLEEISGLEHIKEIGVAAFTRCKFKEFHWPEKCKTIPEKCFYLCIRLHKVNNLSNVEKVGEKAFCNSCVEEFVFSDKLSEISSYAFQNTKMCSKIDIGDNVCYIGEGAFAGSDIEGEFNWPAKCHTVYPKTFSRCEKLECVNNLYDVVCFGTQAFDGSGIKRLDLSCCNAFFDNSSLSNLPSDCEIIPSYYASRESLDSAFT